MKFTPLPEYTLFTYHWNEGLKPPLIGFARKPTDVPWQIGKTGFDVIFITGLTICVTWILKVFDVTSFCGTAQASLEITEQEMVSLLDKVLEEKTESDQVEKFLREKIIDYEEFVKNVVSDLKDELKEDIASFGNVDEAAKSWKI